MDAETRATHMRIARQVRDEHSDDSRCEECPASGRCPRLAAWTPWIYYLTEMATWP